MKEFSKVILIGAGGTGSYVLPSLLRLLVQYNYRKSHAELLDKVEIVDGDNVERKNLYRQHLSVNDVEKNKADLMAIRYIKHFESLKISSYPFYVEDVDELVDLLEENCIIISCGDNDYLRRIIYGAFKKFSNITWIDSGNEEFSGQVILGMKRKRRKILPTICDIWPELQKAKNDVVRDTGCSNLELNEADTESKQQLATNFQAASCIISLLDSVLRDAVKVRQIDFNVKNCIMDAVPVQV
jgi:molybdopterin/thiamine biosynthesis adenylyltransferase